MSLFDGLVSLKGIIGDIWQHGASGNATKHHADGIEIVDALGVRKNLLAAAGTAAGHALIHGQPIDFSAISAPVHSAGKAYWDTAFKTLAVMLEGDSILQVGQETMCYVYNGTGSPITEGSVVYILGTDGAGIPSIGLADASDLAKSYVLGVVTTTSIASGSYGYVTIRGHVNDLKTDYAGWAVGGELYLSDTTPGGLTKTAPAAGNYDVRIGRVMIVHASTGRVYVNVRPLATLASLGDVTVTNPATDELLRYNGVEWVNGPAADRPAPKSKTFADTGYSALVEDSLYVDASGGTTSIVLPTAAAGNSGRRIQIKKTDSSVNAVNVTVTGGGNIDGAATDAISAQYESHTYESNGTQWWLI